MAAAAAILAADGREVAAAALRAEAVGKAAVCVCTLVELGRKGPVADYEEAAVAACLRRLYAADQIAAAAPRRGGLLEARPEQVRAVVLDRGDGAAYDRLIDPLQRSLRALLDGQFGDVFSRQVVRPADRPPVLNIDTSRIKAGDPRFLAAVTIAAWSEMYGMVEADQALADEQLAPRRLYCLTLDELWRVLRLGGSMPDRVNELTRLNRTQGVGQIMISHSIRDLAPGRNSEIEGIEERAGAIVIGGVPKKELTALDAVVTLTSAEQAAIKEWWSTSVTALERNQTPPGAGKFLIKASSEDPGIPVDVVLTSVARAWGGPGPTPAPAAGEDERRPPGHRRTRRVQPGAGVVAGPCRRAPAAGRLRGDVGRRAGRLCPDGARPVRAGFPAAGRRRPGPSGDGLARGAGRAGRRLHGRPASPDPGCGGNAGRAAGQVGPPGPVGRAAGPAGPRRRRPCAPPWTSSTNHHPSTAPPLPPRPPTTAPPPGSPATSCTYMHGTSAGSSAGAPTGPTTPKPAPASKHSGDPGKPSAWTPASAWPPGTATTSTHSCPSCSARPAPSPAAPPANTNHQSRYRSHKPPRTGYLPL